MDSRHILEYEDILFWCRVQGAGREGGWATLQSMSKLVIKKHKGNSVTRTSTTDETWFPITYSFILVYEAQLKMKRKGFQRACVDTVNEFCGGG